MPDQDQGGQDSGEGVGGHPEAGGRLVTGEASHGLKDQSEGALKISELIAEHVKAFKLDGARNEMIEAMMEHGYTRAMAINIVDKKLEG